MWGEGWSCVGTQVTEENELTIDARSSFDPDDPTPLSPQYPFGNFYYYFDCFNVTTDGLTPEPFPFNQVRCPPTRFSSQICVLCTTKQTLPSAD